MHYYMMQSRLMIVKFQKCLKSSNRNGSLLQQAGQQPTHGSLQACSNELMSQLIPAQVPDLLQLRDLLAQTTQDLFDVLEDAHSPLPGLPLDSNPGAIVLQASPSKL